MPDERIEVSRLVAAPSDRIFALLCSPQGHVSIDGSGMLLATDSPPVNAVGDTFEVHMDRRPLGDVPDMAEYDVTVLITAYEQDRVIEWSVGTTGRPPYGHVYGYRLEPSGSDTVVTSYCDWSGLPQHRKDRSRWPVVPATLLEKSLVNLDQAVTAAN
jgi:hypothetical protein